MPTKSGTLGDKAQKVIFFFILSVVILGLNFQGVIFKISLQVLGLFFACFRLGFGFFVCVLFACFAHRLLDPMALRIGDSHKNFFSPFLHTVV